MDISSEGVTENNIIKSVSLACGGGIFILSLCTFLLLYHKLKHMWKFYQHDCPFFMSLLELELRIFEAPNTDGHLCLEMIVFCSSILSMDDTQWDYLAWGMMNTPQSTFSTHQLPLNAIIKVSRATRWSRMNTVKIDILKCGKNRWESFICRSKNMFMVALSAPVLRKGKCRDQGPSHWGPWQNEKKGS